MFAAVFGWSGVRGAEKRLRCIRLCPSPGCLSSGSVVSLRGFLGPMSGHLVVGLQAGCPPVCRGSDDQLVILLLMLGQLGCSVRGVGVCHP